MAPIAAKPWQGCAPRSHQTRIYGIETNLEYLRQVLRLRGSGIGRHRHLLPARFRLSPPRHRGGRTGDADHRAGLSRPPRILACRRAAFGTDGCALLPTRQSSGGQSARMPRCWRSPSPVLRCASTCDTVIAITGADFGARLDGVAVPRWQAVAAKAGAVAGNGRGARRRSARLPGRRRRASMCRPTWAAAAPSSSASSAAMRDARCGLGDVVGQGNGCSPPGRSATVTWPSHYSSSGKSAFSTARTALPISSRPATSRRSSPPPGRCTTTPTAPASGSSGPSPHGRARMAAKPACTLPTSTTTPTPSAPSTSPATCP